MTKRVTLFEKFPVDLLTAEVLINTIVRWCARKEKKKLFYVNVHTVVEASRNNILQRSLQKADIVYPDGWGPVLAAEIINNLSATRVNAADFIDDLFDKLNDRKIRLYLVGDSKDTVKSAAKNIELLYKNIKVVGYDNGFFDQKKSDLIVKGINLKRPSLVMIGMGQSKQEIWVSKNYSRLPNAVYWGVGGMFNYLARTKNRAPKWMLKYKVEWLYRFFQEPRRLWRRYTIENIEFLVLVFKYWLKVRFKNSRK